MCSSRKALHVLGIARDERRRHQVLEVQHEDLLGRVAHVRRIVDDQRLRVDALEQMRRRDVGHVERRVLPQQHHVPVGEVFRARAVELVVAADLVLDRQRSCRAR